jgi:hypothetical protein
MQHFQHRDNNRLTKSVCSVCEFPGQPKFHSVLMRCDKEPSLNLLDGPDRGTMSSMECKQQTSGLGMEQFNFPIATPCAGVNSFIFAWKQ